MHNLRYALHIHVLKYFSSTREETNALPCAGITHPARTEFSTPPDADYFCEPRGFTFSPYTCQASTVHYRQQSMDTAAFHVEIVQGASGFKPFA